MLGRKRATTGPAESAAVRREREALDRLRAEIGERLEQVKRREAAVEKQLVRLEGAPSEPDPEVLRGLEERSLELDRRQEELAAREAGLADRERGLADREAIVEGPAELERRLAEIERRHEELARAEQVFLRTRQELLERSEAVATREEELRAWQRELEAGGASSAVFLPPLDDDPDVPAPSRRARGSGFSSGLRALQHRGVRRPRTG